MTGLLFSVHKISPHPIRQKYYCRGETASGRSREARARQIVCAGKQQAQDARATKKARPETKSKKTVESNYG